MKIAIIDDEKHWREEIKKILYLYYEKEELEVDIFKDGMEYLKSKGCYDISLVDIELPQIDGFEVIQKAKQYNGDGIFIILTTHTELSRKGYLVNAFRYVDKINMSEELYEALHSAELLLERNERITVNVVGEGSRELILKNIIYIETEKHCILIHTKHGVKRCSNNMRDIEKLLSGKWFYRCHNSFIVNLDEIKNIENTIIYMSNGDNIDISHRRIWEFKKIYLKRQYECANG